MARHHVCAEHCNNYEKCSQINTHEPTKLTCNICNYEKEEKNTRYPNIPNSFQTEKKECAYCGEENWFGSLDQSSQRKWCDDCDLREKARKENKGYRDAVVHFKAKVHFKYEEPMTEDEIIDKAYEKLGSEPITEWVEKDNGDIKSKGVYYRP